MLKKCTPLLAVLFACGNAPPFLRVTSTPAEPGFGTFAQEPRAARPGNSAPKGNAKDPLAELPAVVKSTVRKELASPELQGATVTDVERDREDGKIVFKIEAELDDGTEIELEIAPDGTLLDIDIDAPLRPEERRLVPGVRTPSSDTVALWLFDETDYPHTTITDASEYAKADLCLMDGGALVAGKFGNALRISGSEHAVGYAGFAGKVSEEDLRERDGTPSAVWGPTEGSVALLEGLAGKAWTLEFWWNLDATPSQATLLDLGQAHDSGVTLTFDAAGFTLTNHFAGVRVVFPSQPPTPGIWQHVAFTYDGNTVACFLDGTKPTSGRWTESQPQKTPVPDPEKPETREHDHRGFKAMSFEERRRHRFNVAVGTNRLGKQPMQGRVDEVRVSRVVRYEDSFTPSSFSRQYGSDAPSPPRANGPSLLFGGDTPEEPLAFGSRRHIFLDDAILETKTNLTITLNHPFGKEPIGKDFAIRKSSWRPSVFDVNGTVFLAMPEGYSSEEGKTFLATSKNGLDFELQGLIVPETPMYGAFFRDLNPEVPAEETYKVNAFVSTRGMYFYTSPDGINWRRNETLQLPLRSGGEGECFWDDQRGRYASYIKRDSSFHNQECPRPGGRVGVGFWTPEILKPWPFHRMETPYFEGYPFPSVTCEGPTSFGVTEAGEVYRIRVIKYPWAADAYLAFIWRYSKENDEVRHIDLGISRDGENWSYFGTNWYIPEGDSEEELTLYGLIRRGDEIWQYVDEGGAHGGDQGRTYYRYRQRLDGFVSLDGDDKAGQATTRPLIVQGERLIVNVLNTSQGRSTSAVKVAIIDDAGQEIPGFGLNDCDPVPADATQHTVSWRKRTDISRLAGHPIRLRFELRNAKLFAFEVAE